MMNEMNQLFGALSMICLLKIIYKSELKLVPVIVP